MGKLNKLSKPEKIAVVKMSIVMMLLSIPELLAYYAGVGMMSNTLLRISILSSYTIFSYVSLKKAFTPGYASFVLIFAWMYIVSLFHLTPQMHYLTLASISILMVCGLLSGSNIHQKSYCS